MNILNGISVIATCGIISIGIWFTYITITVQIDRIMERIRE
jgi:hypothetical protein